MIFLNQLVYKGAFDEGLAAVFGDEKQRDICNTIRVGQAL
jgi:hypothetical protein